MNGDIGIRIPRRIIQTGKNFTLPLLNQACQSNLRLLNPDYEYEYFDDAKVLDFFDTVASEYRAIFDSFKWPIQRYDFFRYVVIYCLGGFYFDLDVLLVRNLDCLLDRDCVFPFEELSLNWFLRHRCSMDWEVGNYAFGATPKHPFIKAVIDNCIRAQKDRKWAEAMMQGIPRALRCQFYVPNTTGPGLVSRTLVENPFLQDRVSILFPDDVCDERNGFSTSVLDTNPGPVVLGT